ANDSEGESDEQRMESTEQKQGKMMKGKIISGTEPLGWGLQRELFGRVRIAQRFVARPSLKLRRVRFAQVRFAQVRFAQVRFAQRTQRGLGEAGDCDEVGELRRRCGGSCPFFV
ncbi:MAG: hypothetical protein K9N47_05900, partial [Prosthecobacter sp.]|uniref:hypothetical protein n=1 Tax=Prosthecobacter sp. TaxID=1965333 RepID=UPI0025FC8DC3